MRRIGTCPNKLRISADAVNEAVLAAIEERALTSDAVEQVIRLTERDGAQEHQARLAREVQDVEKGIQRTAEAIVAMGHSPS